MPDHVELRPGAYYDSVSLMQVSRKVQPRPASRRPRSRWRPTSTSTSSAAWASACPTAPPNDLVVAIRGDEAGIAAGRLRPRRPSTDLSRRARTPAASARRLSGPHLGGAIRRSGADLALVSVPGEHAVVRGARRRPRRGLASWSSPTTSPSRTRSDSRTPRGRRACSSWAPTAAPPSSAAWPSASPTSCAPAPSASSRPRAPGPSRSCACSTRPASASATASGSAAAGSTSGPTTTSSSRSARASSSPASARCCAATGAPAQASDAALRFDDGRLDARPRAPPGRVEGRPVELTPSEFKLLFALAKSPGRVFSRFELINRVQGHDYDGYERTIDAHVKNLRRKIEPDAHPPALRPDRARRRLPARDLDAMTRPRISLMGRIALTMGAIAIAAVALSMTLSTTRWTAA